MRRHRATGGVQTFSFLDAMVCTMGALLVLVHAFARHGQVQAIKNPELKAASANHASMMAEIETLQWRAAQLKDMRDKTQAQLADERLKLSHVEEHERRLAARLEELRIAAAEMEKAMSASGEGNQHAADELAAAQARVREAKKALAEAKRTARQGGVQYSVVPYEGPNSTRRRPIYIECRADSLVLQPEGVELRPEDFGGFLGPGNPLASAVRGISEYWARQAPAGQAPEPYPLLLVRPEGVQAYYDARVALSSWSSDFGYELIGSDWELKFPERDEPLAKLTREIVADASLRMQALVASLEQMHRHRPRTTLRASAGGGFVEVPSSQFSSGRGPGGDGAEDWRSMGSGWARGEAGDEPGDGVDGGATARGVGRDGYDRAARGGDRSLPGGPSRSDGEYGGTRDGGSRYSNDAPDRVLTGGGSRSASKPGREGDVAGDGRSRRSGQADDGKPVVAGGAYDNVLSDPRGGGRASAGQAGSAGTSGRPSAGDSASGSAAPSGSSTLSASPGSTSAGSASSSSSQQSASGGTSATMGSHGAKSMAHARGRDWGLPEGSTRSAPATRPILVECHPDRLVIPSDVRGRPPFVVKLGPNAQGAMDDFVSGIWDHMKGWGTAGSGLYWRPTLLMDVKPGAAARYAEVKTLSSDSGLDVEQRQPRGVARPPARNNRK